MAKKAYNALQTILFIAGAGMLGVFVQVVRRIQERERERGNVRKLDTHFLREKRCTRAYVCCRVRARFQEGIVHSNCLARARMRVAAGVI